MRHEDGTSTPPVAIGVVLAGGESRRMGRDKRILRLEGSSLLERNLDLLRRVFPRVAVSTRAERSLDLPPLSDVELIYDRHTGSPLAAIATVLERYREPVFVLAADVAFADRRAVERVVASSAGADVTLPVVDGHLEPLHAVYTPACLPHIEVLLARGQHSILDLLPEVRVARVTFESAAAFFNVNTPHDWDEARRRAGETAAARDAQRPALLAVIGRPGSGKTTLIEALIPELRAFGLRIGAVKRVADFEVDKPGKDSWRHGRAGAEAYVICSSSKLAFVAELRQEQSLDGIVRRFFAGFDLVICEGFRKETRHSIEVFRLGAGHEAPLCEPGETLALVTDAAVEHEHRFALGEAAGLASFIAERLGLAGSQD